MTRQDIKQRIEKCPWLIMRYYTGQRWLLVWFLTEFPSKKYLNLRKYDLAVKKFIYKYEDEIPHNVKSHMVRIFPRSYWYLSFKYQINDKILERYVYGSYSFQHWVLFQTFGISSFGKISYDIYKNTTKKGKRLLLGNTYFKLPKKELRFLTEEMAKIHVCSRLSVWYDLPEQMKIQTVAYYFFNRNRSTPKDIKYIHHLSTTDCLNLLTTTEMQELPIEKQKEIIKLKPKLFPELTQLHDDEECCNIYFEYAMSQ